MSYPNSLLWKAHKFVCHESCLCLCVCELVRAHSMWARGLQGENEWAHSFEMQCFKSFHKSMLQFYLWKRTRNAASCWGPVDLYWTRGQVAHMFPTISFPPSFYLPLRLSFSCHWLHWTGGLNRKLHYPGSSFFQCCMCLRGCKECKEMKNLPSWVWLSADQQPWPIILECLIV